MSKVFYMIPEKVYIEPAMSARHYIPEGRGVGSTGIDSRFQRTAVAAATATGGLYARVEVSNKLRQGWEVLAYTLDTVRLGHADFKDGVSIKLSNYFRLIAEGDIKTLQLCFITTTKGDVFIECLETLKKYEKFCTYDSLGILKPSEGVLDTDVIAGQPVAQLVRLSEVLPGQYFRKVSDSHWMLMVTRYPATGMNAGARGVLSREGLEVYYKKYMDQLNKDSEYVVDLTAGEVPQLSWLQKYFEYMGPHKKLSVKNWSLSNLCNEAELGLLSVEGLQALSISAASRKRIELKFSGNFKGGVDDFEKLRAMLSQHNSVLVKLFDFQIVKDRPGVFFLKSLTGKKARREDSSSILTVSSDTEDVTLHWNLSLSCYTKGGKSRVELSDFNLADTSYHIVKQVTSVDYEVSAFVAELSELTLALQSCNVMMHFE